MKKNVRASMLACLAALFYALNMPFSKLLLNQVGPTMMAAFLYLGAGMGMSVLYMLDRHNNGVHDRLTKPDLPYTVMMIILDIIAPVLLMTGLGYTQAANASLLNNFEIVATSLIAFCIFKEKISFRLGIGIMLVTLSSCILTFEDHSSLSFSWGSLLVLLAASCWGLENNCTRKIADKNTYQIVMLKGVFSGMGSLFIALIIHEQLPSLLTLWLVILLGFVAYGLSIFCYIQAQDVLGAAKTSAYYAFAPFIGAMISSICFHEQLSKFYVLALVIMILGTVMVVIDTMMIYHCHEHVHIIKKGQDYKKIVHSHKHCHLFLHHHFHAKGEGL